MDSKFFTPVFAHLPDESLVDINVVKTVTGFSRTVWMKALNQGIYPRQVRIGKQSVRWVAGEIREVLRTLIAARNS